MSASNFSGPVVSPGGFTGPLTGNVASSSVNIGGGGAFTYAKKAAVTVDPASIAAGAIAEETVTVSGAVAGDLVLVSPPTTLNAGIGVVGAYVSAADTVKLRLLNSTGGAVDIASASWIFGLLR